MHLDSFLKKLLRVTLNAFNNIEAGFIVGSFARNELLCIDDIILSDIDIGFIVRDSPRISRFLLERKLHKIIRKLWSMHLPQVKVSLSVVTRNDILKPTFLVLDLSKYGIIVTKSTFSSPLHSTKVLASNHLIILELMRLIINRTINIMNYINNAYKCHKKRNALLYMVLFKYMLIYIDYKIWRNLEIYNPSIKVKLSLLSELSEKIGLQSKNYDLFNYTIKINKGILCIDVKEIVRHIYPCIVINVTNLADLRLKIAQIYVDLLKSLEREGLSLTGLIPRELQFNLISLLTNFVRYIISSRKIILPLFALVYAIKYRTLSFGALMISFPILLVKRPSIIYHVANILRQW